MKCLPLLAALIFAAPAASAQESAGPPRLAPGNYTLSAGLTAALRQRLAIVKVSDPEPGKPPITVVASAPGGNPAKLGDIKLDGGKLTMTVTRATPSAVEGTVSPDGKSALGTLTQGERVFRLLIEPTDKDKLAQADLLVQPAYPEAFTKKRGEFNAPASAIRRKLRAAKGDERAKLAAELAEAEKEAAAKFGPLVRELIATTKDQSLAADVAEQSLGTADADGLSADEVKTYVALVEADARKYGPRFEAFTRPRLAGLLATQKATAALAIPYAEAAAATPGLSTGGRAQCLKALAAALEKTGQSGTLPKVRAELAKLDAELDAEYLKNVPPFKPEPYKGRQDAKANKVAVLELFTGSQCPPCVAADVAFGALIDSHPAKDVVLLQYHLHIPGPDPMTNPDSEARFNAYRERFEGKFPGTPTVAINGKPIDDKLADPIGGPMSGSKAAYDALAESVGGALEQSTPATLAGSATAEGNAIAVKVRVDGIKEQKESVKLRIVLTEEVVRYPGGNGVRLHHHVVRGFANGIGGTPLTELKSGEFATTIDLEKVRADLRAYLTKAAETRPTLGADRPLDLAKLHVVALVQDDETGEILQAVTLGGGK